MGQQQDTERDEKGPTIEPTSSVSAIKVAEPPSNNKGLLTMCGIFNCLLIAGSAFLTIKLVMGRAENKLLLQKLEEKTCTTTESVAAVNLSADLEAKEKLLEAREELLAAKGEALAAKKATLETKGKALALKGEELKAREVLMTSQIDNILTTPE